MRFTSVLLVFLTLFAGACAGPLSARKPNNGGVTQYQGGQTPAAEEPEAEPQPAIEPKNKINLETPDGWKDVTGLAPTPKGVIAMFMHEGEPRGIIAVDVKRTATESVMDSIRHLVPEIEDAKIVMRVNIFPDGLHGSFDWTSAIDGSGSSGHGVLVRFPAHPDVTFAFLGFWSSKDQEILAPVVDRLAETASLAE